MVTDLPNGELEDFVDFVDGNVSHLKNPDYFQESLVRLKKLAKSTENDDFVGSVAELINAFKHIKFQ